jgi:hypothetical protein
MGKGRSTALCHARLEAKYIAGMEKVNVWSEDFRCDQQNPVNFKSLKGDYIFCQLLSLCYFLIGPSNVLSF